MKNAQQVQLILQDTLTKLVEGKINPQVAKEISNNVNVQVRLAATELVHKKMRAEVPDLEFFKPVPTKLVQLKEVA